MSHIDSAGHPALAGTDLAAHIIRWMTSLRTRGLPTLLAMTLCAVLAISSLPARAVEGGPAPFDHDLQRLAEILGALHYLRALCGANEGQKWRNEMLALIEAEAPSGERRAKIVANFNRGYRGFQQTYRTCTPAADIAIRRYLEEGTRISRDITARYAN